MSILQKIDSFANQENAIAHVYRDSQLSYQDLVQHSNALASYIIQETGNDKTPIVVYGHKQHEMLISFLACVKAGHPYIPIDSSLPTERIYDIIDSSQTKLLLNVGNFDFNFPNIIVKDKEQILSIIKEHQDEVPDPKYQVRENDVYYIIYTSGSTGKPKGVQITLHNLESFVSWGLSLISKQDTEALKQSVFMNQAPFSFDLSVMDLYLALASGSILYSVDKQMIENPKELFFHLRESGIGVWVSTPSFADLCLADSNFNHELLPKLNDFLFCGEILSNTTVKKLHDRFPNSRVINTYGPTEATVAVTSIEITKEINETISPLPVGYVKKDNEILIVDSEGKEVPPGEKGEIIIVGESVSKGYYNNLHITEKVFANVEWNGHQVNLYKTGDEGFLKDGILYFSGRIDFQIKLNGYRIELEDIENNLRKIGVVKNAVVLPIWKEGKVQSLIAILSLNEAIEEKEFKMALMIKNELKKQIPEYMIPRKIMFRESLPMTLNGKVDRKKLMEEIG